VGVVGDPVGCGAEQVVAEEMAAVADDDQVMAVRAGVVSDDLGGMARHQLGCHLDATFTRLRVRPLEDPPEVLVLLAFDLIDLAQ